MRKFRFLQKTLENLERRLILRILIQKKQYLRNLLIFIIIYCLNVRQPL